MKNFDERMQSIRNRTQQLRSHRQRKAIIALSCTGVFVAALLLTLFVPYSTALPSMAAYKDSPYYHVIQKLNAYSYEPPVYKNNFQALLGWFSSMRKVSGEYGNMNMGATMDAVTELVPESDMVYGGTGSYVEVTDNQVAGVIESDVFKRSDKYIYHLYQRTLSIYSIAGEDSEKLASYAVSDFLPKGLTLQDTTELYLSQDCTTLTLVLVCWEDYKECTLLMNLDVSDPQNVKNTQTFAFEGYNVATRMTDGQLLLTYRYSASGTADFDKPESFVPTYQWEGQTLCIPGEDILVPQSISTKTYTVVCKLDGATLTLLDSKALMSYTSDIYVSQENIYAWYPYWQIVEESDTEITTRQLTDITCIGYNGEELQVKHTFTVEGTIHDQYSLDEYDGMLRAVTSTVSDKSEKINLGPQPDIWLEPANISANLYCFDLETGETAGKVEAFAPQGEEVTSVRFDGIAAYVCTAEVWTLSDPVFFFDLSDPANITWTDTGTIDGYSTSLVDFGEGTLLGIGYDDSRCLKVEVYRREGQQVVSIAQYIQDCYFLEDYKSYYIDRENGYIGLAVVSYDTVEFQYLLLSFDGQTLMVEKQLPIDSGGLVGIRADLIGEWLYILYGELTVVKP